MYRIEITQISIRERPAGKEWKVVDKDINGKEEYGYTPGITKKQEVKKQILIQEVETLDLVSVLKAINDIK